MVVFLEHKIYATAGGDVPGACVALKSSGMGQYVSETFNSNSLSAWAREQYQIYQSEHPDEIVTLEQFVATLPPELQSAIKITETVKVKAKKG
jgi:hypothetical protein